VGSETETVSSRSARARPVAVATVLGPSALAAVLSFYDLAKRSIWLDESASISIASQHGAALGAAMAHDGGNMLVYYALLHVLIGAFGNGIFVIRAPSAVATACTVAFVSLIARRLFDPGIALASGILSAVSLPLVYWGQDARAYATMVALVSASFFCFIVLVDRDPATPPRRWAFAGYAAATTLALYMSFVAVLVVPAQLLALVWHRKRLRPVVTALVIAALCSVPLAVLARQRGTGQLFWVQKPGLGVMNSTWQEVTSASLQPQFASTATSGALYLVTSAILLLALGLTVRTLIRGDDERGTFSLVLLVSWVVVPIVLALVESVVGQSIMVPRNLLICLPPVAILLARVLLPGTGATRKTLAGLAWRPGWLVVALLVALRALQLAPSYPVSPENWKAAVTFVLARSHPGDCIAFYPSDGRMAFEYYIGARASAETAAPRPVLPTAPWGVVRAYVEDYATLSPRAISRVVGECPRLWLVASHYGTPDGTRQQAANYARFAALRTALAYAYLQHPGFKYFRAAFGYSGVIEVLNLSR
jgi:mannosyltransferase